MTKQEKRIENFLDRVLIKTTIKKKAMTKPELSMIYKEYCQAFCLFAYSDDCLFRVLGAYLKRKKIRMFTVRKKYLDILGFKYVDTEIFTNLSGSNV